MSTLTFKASLIFKSTRGIIGRLSSAYYCTGNTTAKDLNVEDKAFDESILKVIVCPLSKTDLRYDADKNVLICDELSVSYPIVNGIPNLCPEDATKL